MQSKLDVDYLAKKHGISWRDALDMKQAYLCSTAKRMTTRRRRMAIGAKVAEPVKGWKEVQCQGFKMSKEGNHMMGTFKIIETGDLASVPFKYPLKRRELTGLLTALGKSLDILDLDFPETADEDKLGFDMVILGNVIEDGQYINIKGFKPSTDTPSNNSPF